MPVDSGLNSRCQTVSTIDDRCQFQEPGLPLNDRGGSKRKDNIDQEDVCTSGLWLQNFLPFTIENVNLRQRLFGNLLCIHGVQPHTVGLLQANNCLNRQQINHQVFSNQNDSTFPLERL